MTSWREFQLHLGMPHFGPGRLSDEALFKQLASFQWQAAAALAAQPENGVMSEDGERLFLSMISAEIGMPAERSWEEFDEGTELRFFHRIGVFGSKLVQGLFVFDREPIPDDELGSYGTRDELVRGKRPWAVLGHGFVSRGHGNWAKLETPQAYLAQPLPELPAVPDGIAEHLTVERTGRIDGFPDWASALRLTSAEPYGARYEVHPETDYNFLGRVYCVRVPSILAVGERHFLRQRLSEPLCACLSTLHRRVYYFAGASIEDHLDIRVHACFCPPPPPRPVRMRPMGRFLFRSDLHRASDGVLMASALVERVLRVPGAATPLLMEAERFAAHLQSRSPS